MCTANVLDTIPAPLLDRMEVIRLVGYIADEKRHIARGYLEPSARTASGVKGEEVRGKGSHNCVCARRMDPLSGVSGVE